MKIKAKWEYPAVIPEKSTDNTLMLQLETPATKGQNRQLVVILALDRSWSMKGDKMQSICDAAVLFLNWLTRNDVLGVVTYAQDVKVNQKPVLLNDKNIIADKIRNISLGTSTNLSSGWLQALRLAESYESPDSIRRVILLTDGRATMGIREDEKLVEIARQYASKGIHTSTIGVGDDFNEQNLRNIARAGEGSFYFIETPEQASDIFYQEFGNIRSLYAQAPEIRFYFPEGVRLNSVLADAEIDELSDGVAVRTGDIPADDLRQIILDFNMKAGNTDIAISGELIYYNVTEDMQEQRHKFKIPVKTSTVEPVRNSSVSEQFIIAFAARGMEKVSSFASNDAAQAAEEMTRLNAQVEKLMIEKNCRPAWLTDRLRAMSEKLNADSNIGRKQMLAESSKIFRHRSRQAGSVTEKEVLRYALKENLDLYKVPEFSETMNRHLAGGIRFILLDLSACAFLDSSAIGALIQLSNSLVKRGGLLIVHSVQSALQKVFTATRLDKFVPMADDEHSAESFLPRD